jgi:ABC-type branched-subunit amino acid transport system substrate-binding protein
VVLNSSAFASQVPALLKPVNARYPNVTTPIVTVPATAVDLSAVVAQAAKSAAIGLNLGSQDSLASFLSAYSQSGSKTPIYSNNFSVTQNTINKLGSLVEGMYIVSDELPPSDSSDPKMADYVKWMDSVDSKALQDTASLHSYDAVTLISQAITGMTDATSRVLFAKLNTMTNIQLAGLPSLEFTTPSSELKVFPRVFNAAVILLQVKNGKLELVTGKFVDSFTGVALTGQK